MHDVLIELAVRIYAARVPYPVGKKARSDVMSVVENRRHPLPIAETMHAHGALYQVGFRSHYLLAPTGVQRMVYLPVGDEFHMNLRGIWYRTTKNPTTSAYLHSAGLTPIKETSDVRRTG